MTSLDEALTVIDTLYKTCNKLRTELEVSQKMEKSLRTALEDKNMYWDLVDRENKQEIKYLKLRIQDLEVRLNTPGERE